jgi:hypothetical protein
VVQETGSVDRDELRAEVRTVRSLVTESLFVVNHRDSLTPRYIHSHLEDLARKAQDSADNIGEKHLDEEAIPYQHDFTQLAERASRSITAARDAAAVGPIESSASELQGVADALTALSDSL